MRFVRARFVATLFFSSLLAVLLGGAASLFFLPWVYSAEVQDGESLVVIRAPQGGIVRSLRAVKGEQVRADAIVAEILVTDIQPPNALLAREILYKRVENARYESQRGGLKQVLLKPDLRARLALDRDYASFVAEQRRLFRSFQTKLTKATKSLQKERSRLDVQVRGMEGEIASLLQRQALLDQKLGEDGGSELRSEAKRNRRSLQRDRKQLRDLRRKVLSNAKALLKVTLRVRREQSVGMEEVRAELNALYARMGLPSNAFDRIGLVESSGGQRLRRLIARRAGRVVRVAEDVRPGDVVVGGRVLVEILPSGRRSSYRLRLEDAGGVLSRAVGRGEMKVRSLRCQDFPQPLAWQGRSADGGELLLERSLLRAENFPSVREGGRCSVVAGLEGRGGDFVLGFAWEVFGGRLDWGGLRGGMESMWKLAKGAGEVLWVRLDFLRGEDRIKKTEVILQNFVDDIRSSKINN